MLNSVNLNDKTYDELLAEAIAQIPIYSKEWTNYNVSDPGITILQNLTAFQLVQQEAINQVSEESLRKLLKLVGYTARENRAAEVLVQAPCEGGEILPEGHLLWSGTIPFETTQTVPLQPWGLLAVEACSGGEWRDLTRLLDPSTDAVAYPFGRRPKAGNALVCVLTGTPEMGEPLYLWIQVAEEELRTPFEDRASLPEFSRVRWQYYTADGWRDARAEDETMGFLRSGVVKLWLEGELPAPLRDAPVSGCALRCILEAADYDRTPRLKALAAHLFPMKQRETRVHSYVCDGKKVALRGRLPKLGNLFVYCRETPGGPYRMYREAPARGGQGRYWRREEKPWGVALYFDYGMGPGDGEDSVRVVCYDNEMIHHRVLGMAYGYDRQVIQLEQVENVLPESLLLAVETDGGDCCFVMPGEAGPDGFRYHLRSQAAQVVIDDPGRGGYALYLAGCAVTQGRRGNLRPGAVLEQRGGYDGTEVEERYFCPSPVRFGESYESVEELRVRFSAGMRQISVAARTEDYEALVRKTPGLCIHKVKAVAFADKNLVRIAVKPYTEETLPKLSAEYLRQISAFLEPHRMLTTRFELCQPRYAPIGVSAILSIRGMAAHAQEEAERLLRELLDHVNGPQNFGGWVRFHEVYQNLSLLPFVDRVDALNLFPESRDAVLTGSDIHLEDDCLCYAGSIRLTCREYGR